MVDLRNSILLEAAACDVRRQLGIAIGEDTLTLI